jgi:hypothetical protein
VSNPALAPFFFNPDFAPAFNNPAFAPAFIPSLISPTCDPALNPASDPAIPPAHNPAFNPALQHPAFNPAFNPAYFPSDGGLATSKKGKKGMRSKSKGKGKGKGGSGLSSKSKKYHSTAAPVATQEELHQDPYQLDQQYSDPHSQYYPQQHPNGWQHPNPQQHPSEWQSSNPYDGHTHDTHSPVEPHQHGETLYLSDFKEQRKEWGTDHAWNEHVQIDQTYSIVRPIIPATTNQQSEPPRNLKGKRRFRHLREQIDILQELKQASVAKSRAKVEIENPESERANMDDNKDDGIDKEAKGEK